MKKLIKFWSHPSVQIFILPNTVVVQKPRFHAVLNGLKVGLNLKIFSNSKHQRTTVTFGTKSVIFEVSRMANVCVGVWDNLEKRTPLWCLERVSILFIRKSFVRDNQIPGCLCVPPLANTWASRMKHAWGFED